LADVEHSALTGSDLHEPKGVAAASANRVYVADGAGSGSWTTVSNDVLATEAKAFQGGLLHIQDTKAAGTAGGTLTSGVNNVRDLNTVVTNEITGASLASNQITLPAGTYWVEASAPAHSVNGHRAFFNNVTDTVLLITGTVEYATNAVGATTRSFMSGRVTLAGVKLITIFHNVETTNASNGAGEPLGGTTEVYTDVKIWKIA
jgi:hypothetical protein